MLTMIIENDGIFYEPLLTGKVVWTTEKQGTPGSVKFDIIKDDIINFQEGNNLSIYIDGVPFFNGFVFTKRRTKKNIISVTAYDQLRYFKNKDTFAYRGLKASEVITLIAKKHLLEVGDIADTGYVIPKRNENNKTLFDIVGEALSTTIQNTGERYILYDDNGKLTLKNMGDMELNILIDAETAEDLSYESSIDKDTYNSIILVKDGQNNGKQSGIKDLETAEDAESIKKWGLLQYVDTLKDGENGAVKAQKLLGYHNLKTRKLSVKKAFGDIRVRAGSLIAVNLNLGDMVKRTWMLVEKCTHTIDHDVHTMDLTLRGGNFNG